MSNDIGADVRSAARESRKKLRDSQLSQLAITSRPAGMTAELEALAGETLVTPITVWVKAGTHTVKATRDGKSITNTVTTQPYSRATIWLAVRCGRLAE